MNLATGPATPATTPTLLVALLAVVFAVSGCGGIKRVDSSTTASKPVALAMPDQDALYDTTRQRMPGDPARLAEDIGRTFRKLGWGSLHVRWRDRQKDQATAPPGASAPGQESEQESQQHRDVAAAPRVIVEAAALLADGRRATIWAWSHDDDEIDAVIRIGLDGDSALERQFLDALRDTLAGKPKRKYRGDFELPPWPPTDAKPSSSPHR